METINLTFDDGPDRRWTAEVLNELRRCRVPATFFVVGERVSGHEDLLAEIVDSGHDVQLHCHRHIRHTQLSEAELDADTEQALDVLVRAGVTPRLWRPPWGVITERSARAAERYGLQLRRWSIDTHDWRGDPVSEMIAAADPRLPAGGAVLMHDAIGPGARRDDCENTVALIPELVEAARGRGLEVALLTDGVSR